MTARTLFSLVPLAILVLLAAPPASAQTTRPAVRFGIDVLRDSGFAALEGKRVGLVAHPPSVDGNLTPTVDLLRAAGVDLVALYGPEHGIRGDIYAGDRVEGDTDAKTGLPVYSLYGATRKPTPEMLDGIDVLVYDLQDVGCRSYTFVSTLRLCLEACAENGVALVVLDRPNPLGGERIEGPMLDPAYLSFVGMVPTPYVHGMTAGELAGLLVPEVAPGYDKLTVVKMDGWDRSMTWADLDRPWVMTSPHVPHPETCAAYVATGVYGELNNVSVGVGYTLPFEVVGAPGVDADALAKAFAATYGDAGLPAGLEVRPIAWKPFYAAYAGEPCGGVQLFLDPKTDANLTEINLRLMAAVRSVGGPAETPAAGEDKSRWAMFDKVTGGDETRRAFEAGGPLDPLFAAWRDDCEAFRESRRPHLLY